MSSVRLSSRVTFQPTPLSRGATAYARYSTDKQTISTHAPLARGDQPVQACGCSQSHFNPRPSREGRLPQLFISIHANKISTHAPLARGDRSFSKNSFHSILQFQPTPLSRGATRFVRGGFPGAYDFNPRPSREGRQQNRTKTLFTFDHTIQKTEDQSGFHTFLGTKILPKQLLSGCEPSNKSWPIPLRT